MTNEHNDDEIRIVSSNKSPLRPTVFFAHFDEKKINSEAPSETHDFKNATQEELKQFVDEKNLDPEKSEELLQNLTKKQERMNDPEEKKKHEDYGGM